mmetsp:Transcript_25247/g.45699  ORF Transcript_25247/g.45699 Transcript_25247/m.45699 type:complete len:229 (+) Transcript_25247:83-769(+)
MTLDSEAPSCQPVSLTASPKFASRSNVPSPSLSVKDKEFVVVVPPLMVVWEYSIPLVMSIVCDTETMLSPYASFKSKVAEFFATVPVTPTSRPNAGCPPCVTSRFEDIPLEKSIVPLMAMPSAPAVMSSETVQGLSFSARTVPASFTVVVWSRYRLNSPARVNVLFSPASKERPWSLFLVLQPILCSWPKACESQDLGLVEASVISCFVSPCFKRFSADLATQLPNAL